MRSHDRPSVLMTHDYPPVSGGGLARAVSELAHLLDDTTDVTVLSSRLRDHCTDDRGAHPAPGRRSGVRYARASRAAPWRVLRALRAADVVCAHWTFSFRWLATLSVLAAPRLGVPTICVVHTAPAHGAFNRTRLLPDWARRGAIALLAAGMRRCAAVVALGAAHDRALRAAGVPVTHVLPLAVAVPRPSRPYDTLRAAPTVGIAGELSRLKGADRVPALLRVLTPDLAVHIAGAGPLARRIERSVAGLRADQRAAVRLRGWLDADAMGAFYGGVDVLLVLSRTEAQCRVAHEAMLSGVVVAAARDAGVDDAVTPDVTGIVIDADDPAACRRRLLALVRDPARMAGIRRTARARALACSAGAAADWRRLVADMLGGDPDAPIRPFAGADGTRADLGAAT